MKEGLKQHLPMFSPGPADGGTSFWLTGPDHFNAEIFAKCLQERGVLIEPGQIFYKNGEHKNSFRIGFSSVAGSKINAGLKQIAEAAKLFLA